MLTDIRVITKNDDLDRDDIGFLFPEFYDLIMEYGRMLTPIFEWGCAFPYSSNPEECAKARQEILQKLLKQFSI